ncbi:MAG: hypothetical protein FJX25_18315 [Alphaproteobacteria bacterium]|nr:hypothetical protein [Alphaproteobacteria bacterium]
MAPVPGMPVPAIRHGFLRQQPSIAAKGEPWPPLVQGPWRANLPEAPKMPVTTSSNRHCFGIRARGISLHAAGGRPVAA